MEDALSDELDEADRLERQLAATLAKHRELQERRVQLARMQALLRRAPADILDHIQNLVHCGPENVTFPSALQSSPRTVASAQTTPTWSDAVQSRHMHFRSCVVGADALIETLEHLPEIERLTFVECEFEGGVFEALYGMSQDLKLRRLDLWQCRGDGLQTSSLINLLQSLDTSERIPLDRLDIVACPQLVRDPSLQLHALARSIEWS